MTLPPLDEVLARAGGWAAILAASDVAGQRVVLGHLVEKITPVRGEQRGEYRAEIAWTPTGDMLRQATDLASGRAAA
jgi:hypothetical protein